MKNFPLGEADMIVTYITRDFGIIKVFAKSPRKTKSRFGSSLEPLTYSRISFIGKEDVNLPRLTQSDIIKPFQSLREDFSCFNLISESIRIFLDIFPEKESNINAFKLFLEMLLKLQSERRDIYYLYFNIKMLELAGYLPMLWSCGRCGGDITNSNIFSPFISFYPSLGSIICERCGGNNSDSIKVSKGALVFFKSFIKWQPSNIERIRVPENLISEISNIINVHTVFQIKKGQATL